MNKYKAYSEALGSILNRIFHSREIVVHGAHGVRHIAVSARAQMMTAALVALLFGWTMTATVTLVADATSADATAIQLAAKERQVAAMRADVAAIKESAETLAQRLEGRQKFLTALLSGTADPAKLATLMPKQAESADARFAEITSPLAALDGKQLAFVGQATTAAEARYKDTEALIRRLGLDSRRFYRQTAIAMGGPYEAVDQSEADPAFKALFVSWTKVDQLERGLLSVPARMPVNRFSFTSGYGVRYDPFNGGAAMHAGIDMAGPVGEPIYASADAVVERAGWASGYGNLVELDHGKGIETRYGHMSKILVKAGDKVKRGQKIGLMGSTGRSTGSHLHYEVRIDGRSVNPMPFLQSAEMLAAVQDRVTALGGPDGRAAD